MAITLQQAMDAIITVFNSYSGKEGDKYKLNKAELKILLEKELPIALFTLDNEDCKEDIKKIMTDLDENKDGEVDFKEFLAVVTELTVLDHDFFQIIDSME